MARTTETEKLRRSKRFLSLKDRFALYAGEVGKSAARLPPGIERDALLKKARQADAEAQTDGWANTQSLRMPVTPKP